MELYMVSSWFYLVWVGYTFPVGINEELKLNFSRCFFSFEVSFVIWYLVTTSSAQNYKELPHGHVPEAHVKGLEKTHDQSIRQMRVLDPLLVENGTSR